MSEIMLGKSFDLSKLEFPVEVSIKLDGVAADFYKSPNGWAVQSRQGEPLPSAGHIVRLLNKHFSDIEVNTHIVGELTVHGVPQFKDAGGIIRRHAEDRRIILNVYDMYNPNTISWKNYAERVQDIKNLCNRTGTFTERDGNVSWVSVRRVPVIGSVEAPRALQEHFEALPSLMENSDMYEGFMLRTLKGVHSRYKPGKRSLGMMKYKPKPTVDLRVVDFEEATANKTMTFLGEEFNKGDGLRAVGGIVLEYNGGTTKAGPGCLTHAERREIWERYERMKARGASLDEVNLIAEIEYMLDNSYTGLRQPVFKQWRFDKTEPSEVA